MTRNTLRPEGTPRTARAQHDWGVLAAGIAACLGPLIASGAQPPAAELRLDPVRIVAGKVLVSWTGGRPGYQLQGRSSLDGEWTDIGSPTDALASELPAGDALRFFRVVSDAVARYEVTFVSTWSKETHPNAWPAGAHWSGPVGGVHDGSVHFYRLGETASEGIRLMAERGRQTQLASEVEAEIARGHADFVLLGPGFNSPGVTRIEFPKRVRRQFPFVTLTSMVAPSPDWFVGVDSLSLLSGNDWVEEVTVPVYSTDAGTDSGIDFTSPDLVTQPRGVVTRHEEYPARVGDQVVPFGTFTFRRLD